MKINTISEMDMPKGRSMIFRPIKEELYNMYWNKGMSTYQIADNVGYAPKSIENIMREYNIPRRSMSDAKRIYSINKDFFKVWNHVMAYVLGYFCADGNIHKILTYFRFDSKDKELLYATRSAMQSEHPIKKDKSYNGYYLVIGSIEMVQDLLNLGLTPAKSLTLEFPDVPEEFMGSFIRGVFDGDGSVVLPKLWNGIIINIVSGSDKFTLKLNSILHKNDINSRLRQWHGQLCGIYIPKKSEVKKFYDFIYQNNDICLKRKKDIFDKFFNGVD